MQEQMSQAEKMATIGTMADGLSIRSTTVSTPWPLFPGDALDTIGLSDTSNYSPEHKELLKELKYGLERVQDNAIRAEGG